jgi:hypothetical protein
MNTDREIEVTGRLINRKEVRIVEGKIALDASEENARSASVFGPSYFLDGLFDGSQRRDNDPP